MKQIANAALGRLNINEFKKVEKHKIILVLDDIRSLHNIGSIFRTADAFLIQKIILCGITATPPNKEIHKTALGATDTVDWEYEISAEIAIEKLISEKVEVWAIEQTDVSKPLNEFKIDSNKTYALVFGNEVKGVSPNILSLCYGAIEIPQWGSKHSLNVSVSAGIVLWDLVVKVITAEKVNAG
jgi:tRNA G18 (ribose-2'-O)-methylase SpoU